MPCRRFNRHICLTVELSKQTLAGCRGCITTATKQLNYICASMFKNSMLYPGLYRALYAFEPERTCIAKMESDKVQTWGWGPLLCSMAYTSPHLGSDQVPLSGCRCLSLCICEQQILTRGLLQSPGFWGVASDSGHRLNQPQYISLSNC